MLLNVSQQYAYHVMRDNTDLFNVDNNANTSESMHNYKYTTI